MDYEYWLLHLDPLVNAVKHLKSFRPLCRRSVELANGFSVKNPGYADWLQGKTIDLKVEWYEIAYQICEIANIKRLNTNFYSSKRGVIQDLVIHPYRGLYDLEELRIDAYYIFLNLSFMTKLKYVKINADIECIVWSLSIEKIYLKDDEERLAINPYVLPNLRELTIKRTHYTRDLPYTYDLSHLRRLTLGCGFPSESYSTFKYKRKISSYQKKKKELVDGDLYIIHSDHDPYFDVEECQHNH